MSPDNTDHSGGDPHLVAPGTAPTPFTADEIRRGCPTGRSITVMVREGQSRPHLETTRFARSDKQGTVIEMTVRDENGVPLSEPRSVSASWGQLQAHAAFDADRTSVSEETVVTDAGEFDCLRYTVRRDRGVADYWFALDLPGMPIRVRAPGFEVDIVENVFGPD